MAQDGLRGGASSFAILAARGPGFGWPRLLATGVAKRREVATQPSSPKPLAAAPPRLRATAATRKRVVDLRSGLLARGQERRSWGTTPESIKSVDFFSFPWSSV